MIEAISLTKRYGSIEAIHDVSFRVEDGEIAGFLGPNGAGKTTTMRILTGFTPASNGHAYVAGIDVQTNPLGVRSRVGYLPENVALYDEMRLDKYLHYVCAVKGVPRPRRAFEVARVLERCGLESVGRRVIRHLSKGYRQRAGLAQALVGNPPVLILDEPTVGLDPKQIISIRETIRALAGDHTVLLSTHILHEVELLCSRAIIINAGRTIGTHSLGAPASDAAVHVRVSAATPGAAETLRGVAGVAAVRTEDDRNFVLTGAQIDLGEIAGRLNAAGISVEAIESRRRTLEEIFLESIAESAGAEEPAA